MGTNVNREYPPCPHLISYTRAESFWLVVPCCFLICFIRETGIPVAIAVLIAWTIAMIVETWKDWKSLCDNGMVDLEVSNDYLLKYGFIQDKHGSPVRKATKQELLGWETHETNPNVFRYDSPRHPTDEKHGHFDTVAGFWLTKEEWEDKQEYEYKTNALHDKLLLEAVRPIKRLEAQYGWIICNRIDTCVRNIRYNKDWLVKYDTHPEKYLMSSDAEYVESMKQKLLSENDFFKKNPFPDKISEEEHLEIRAAYEKYYETQDALTELNNLPKWKYPKF